MFWGQNCQDPNHLLSPKLLQVAFCDPAKKNSLIKKNSSNAANEGRLTSLNIVEIDTSKAYYCIEHSISSLESWVLRSVRWES